MCLAAPAIALHPNRLISEYIRERWDAQQGFPGGPVYAITQTPDGYLWLGTEKGLVRFDGLTFRLFDQTNSSLPSGPVMELMTDVEGNLWIRRSQQDRSLLRYRDGRFYDVVADFEGALNGVTAMCRGINGVGLFSARIAGVYAYSGGKFSETIPSANALIISIAQTSDGTVWMGSRDAGLSYVNEARITTLAKELPDTKVNTLLAIDRELWIGTDHGVVRWNGHEITNAGLPASLSDIQVLSLTSDRDSNIWIGTSKGLLRLNADGFSQLDPEGHGSSGPVNAIFEDREGNLWIGSSRGIERLRDSSFMTYSAPRGGSSEGSGTIFVDTRGRKWFAPSDGGLYWEKGQQAGYVKDAGLDHDVVYSLTGANDELWIGRQRGGLTHLKYIDGNIRTETYTPADGLVQNSIFTVYQGRDGSVWAGSLSGGVTRFKDGKFTSYTSADGLGSNTVMSILEGTDGTIWFATANGLSSLFQGRWRIYGGKDGLPPGGVNSLFQDEKGPLWVGTDHGIAILRSEQVQVPADVPAALQEPILGIASDKNGYLWISSSNHVLRVYQDKLLEGKVSESDVREFGFADGLRSIEGVKRDRAVIVDPLGQIWFSTYSGFSVVDPAQVADNAGPAIVKIEGVVADGSPVDLQGKVRIPGVTQRITFRYAGLSLSIPERVRFRYRLDGYDQNWSEPVATRDAVYANLAPGPYRFRVMASNSAGLWNGSESTIQFEIEPTFYQTSWFLAACIIGALAALYLLYLVRLKQVSQQVRGQMEARVEERERIARDLHDTLLQSVQGLILKFHAVVKQVRSDDPIRETLEKTLDQADEVMAEGRDRVRSLRGAVSLTDLPAALRSVAEEIPRRQGMAFKAVVEGNVRTLYPMVLEESYSIGREAIINALTHSHGQHVEVEITYQPRQFRLRVRDDGRGIEPGILETGRADHWGLQGMQERADKIGAQLKVFSGHGTGTEVELVIPGATAYRGRRAKVSWFHRSSGTNNE